MKIAIVVTNAGQAANCEGGRCDTRAVLFDLNEEAAQFVTKMREDGYNTLNVVLVEEHRNG